MVDTLTKHIFTCCFAAEQTDVNQIQYTSDPRLEEGRGEPLQVPLSSVGQLPRSTGTGAVAGYSGHAGYADPFCDTGRESSDRAGSVSARSASEGPTPSATARGRSPENKQREKERLQDMVKEFAKAAVQGQQCQQVEPSGVGGPRSATYSIDPGLRTFSLQPHDSDAITVGMAGIQEVVREFRDTQFASLRPSPQLTGEDLLRRFVCVQWKATGEEGEESSLGLIMPNAYERERFYTCMKILRWAMDSRKAKK